MLRIVVAIILAFSLVGGGVVYAAENAPPASPLHGVQIAVNNTASNLHLAASAATATPTPRPKGKNEAKTAGSGTGQAHNPDQDDTHPRPTMTPLPPAVATAIATAEAGIEGLRTDPLVPGHAGNGPENGLDAKLDAVQTQLGHGDAKAASATLDGFVHQLNALERSGHITQANYDALYKKYLDLLPLVNAQASPVATVTPHQHGAGHGQAAAHRSKNQPGK